MDSCVYCSYILFPDTAQPPKEGHTHTHTKDKLRRSTAASFMI